MYPELFDLPFIHLSIKSYGTMMVIGFLLAVLLMRKMSRTAQQDPDHITNVALYALISGVLGARIFYVLHHFSQFKGDLGSVFAVWQGGLEFLGGVILAIVVVFAYLLFNKLPLRLYFDILAVGLMVGLAFGRIGCFMNGCCFGGPTDTLCAVTFPYASPPYLTQIRPDPSRNRAEPYLDLPAEYFAHENIDGVNQTFLKPYEMLTEHQKQQVKEKYHALPIHPTQIYSFFNALVLCAILYAFWRKFGIKHPGCTISLMFMLYGPTRFVLEAIRDDNPFEQVWWSINDGWTVSQNIGIYLAIAATVVFAINCFKKPIVIKKHIEKTEQT